MTSRFLTLLAALALTTASLRAVDIVAHRGASHDAPENTLASEKLAWKQNADVVEDDIWLTKDGKLIVSHDKSTKRATGVDLSIPDTDLAELRKLDAGKWKGEQFAGEKLPTLDEQIALIPAGKRMFVEIKCGPEIVPAFAECLQRMKADEKKITIISFNYESLKECRKVLPKYPTQYLVGYKKTNAKKAPKTPQPTLDEIIAQAKDAKLTGLDLQSTWPLTAADTKKIKDAGLQLHVWTVDDPKVAQHWIELGALSITTNRPGFLREQLASVKQ
jgi:glycerophosphoryl diester phosphodiesterase